MARAALAFASMTLVLAGCAGRTPRPVAVVEPGAPVVTPTGWQALATPMDQQRLAALPAMWQRAVAGVPARGRRAMTAESELVDPDAALELPAPPPGPYRCRLVRFTPRVGVRSFAPDFCYIDGDNDKLSFTKQTGGNLPGGWLFPDGPKRLVFLGALPLAGQKEVPLYGKHPTQDVAGVVERVSAFRWRLTLARAGRGSVLDMYELVPVPPAVPGATPAVPGPSAKR